MGNKRDDKSEATLWEIPDDVWEIVEKVLEREYPKHPYDRKRVSLRRVLNGIIYKGRTGCQWNRIPREFGDDSTIHRHFQAWCELGVFDQVFAEVILRCEELQGVSWQWQAADCSMGKAIGKSKMAEDAVGKNPTDRGKKA